MIKRKRIILLWVGLLAMLTSYSQTKVLPKFWERIEVGTNLIPMVDSLTLQPTNLMVKYYYGKNHDNAFRINLFVNNAEFSSVYNGRYHIQLGHVWYYNYKPKISLYFATDLEYINYSSSDYYYRDDNYIYHANNLHAYLTGGIKYQFYKNFSLELETALKISSVNTFSNHQLTDNMPGEFKTNYVLFNYKPINYLTFNYKFQL